MSSPTWPLTAYVEDLDLATAIGLLSKAISQRPCPATDDQRESVGEFLSLAVARVRALCDIAGLAAPVPWDPETTSAVASFDVMQLKVSLIGAKPPVWRRMELPSDLVVGELHQLIHAALSWEEDDSATFSGRDAAGADVTVDIADAGWMHLSNVLREADDHLAYAYGDWRFDVVLKKRFPAVAGRAYPRCTGGRRAAPPQECRGLADVVRLSAALEDSTDPDHRRAARVLGAFDPTLFRQAVIDEVLKMTTGPRIVS